ncbi:hypothetical protein Taro_027194 [Colocasia esculenta]|uniref:Uncharacterized protein n=1 Tax=Colocasia esculenta TaxID=4460 RepID=A0A843VF30_COLES|nr:hypothetical protein [Colocasia esculenta]
MPSSSPDCNSVHGMASRGRRGFLLVRVRRGEMSLGVRIRASSRPQHPRERADVWWSSMLRTRFEDGAVEVGWDEFVRLF